MKKANKNLELLKKKNKTIKKCKKKIIKRNKKKEEFKTKIEIIYIYEKIIIKLKKKSNETKSLFREDKKKEIINFILKSFSDKKNEKKKKHSTLILYGQPGTGKTLLINELKKQLISKRNNLIKKKIKLLCKTKKNKSLRFITIFMNANNYKSCYNFFYDFTKKLTDNLKINIVNFEAPRKDKVNNYYFLLKKFKNLLSKNIKKNLYLFLMIDELENLFIKDKKNFGSIIDFLSIEYNNFIRFAISNVLDLFSSYKDQKILANFQFSVFKPYNFNEINGIIKNKIYNIFPKKKNFNLNSFFSFKIFEFIGKKIIKNNNGDFRELIRRIIQVFQEKINFINIYFPEKLKLISEEFFKIELQDVSKIFEGTEIQDNELFEIINRLTFEAQVYMLSIYEILNKDFTLINEKNIISNYINLCSTFDCNFKTDFNEIKSVLSNYALIKIIKQKNSILIQSILIKKDLKSILSKIKRFELYFSN